MPSMLALCEFSGAVRDAFTRIGWHAVSCDLIPCETPGGHWQMNARDIPDAILASFDLIVAFPPCTYLCNSGVRWLHTDPERWPLMHDGAEFFAWCLALPAKHVAVENPVMHKYARKDIGGRRADCSAQPYEHGDGETKRTCFWLKGALTPLLPTNRVDGRNPRVHHMSPGPERAKERARFSLGMAQAIANQWGYEASPAFTDL